MYYKIKLYKQIYTDLSIQVYKIDFPLLFFSSPSDSLPTSQPQYEVITTTVTAKETAGQYHGSDEPVRTSRTDEVFSTNAQLSQGNTITFSLGELWLFKTAFLAVTTNAAVPVKKTTGQHQDSGSPNTYSQHSSTSHSRRTSGMNLVKRQQKKLCRQVALS